MSTSNIEKQNSEMPSSFFDNVPEQNQEQEQKQIHNENLPLFLGKYHVVRELGQGGMGKVYLCYDNVLHRHVAIKVIISQYKDRAKKRFLIEAQAIANLDHPNIIKIYELGFTSDGNPYMVMEYIAGDSLKKHMQKKTLSIHEKIAMLLPIADALAHAHRKGVIHRDVKPSNILIDTQNNKCYLMDFGLAKMANVHQELTKTGSVLGSPKYMSPEQARGRSREIDAQTDIYSFGVTLFEIISGVCPVEGNSSMEIVINVMHKNIPPLRKVCPQASRDLETICLKALQKHKNKRYSHMVMFKNDLQLFSEGEPIRARRWHLYSWGICVVTFLVILSAIFTYYSFSTSATTLEVVINETTTQIEHFLQQQLYEKTHELLEQARKQQKISPDAYSFYLARVYSGMGKQQEFNIIYDRLIKQDIYKENAKILLAKAHICIVTKEWTQAQQALDAIDTKTLARRDHALKLFYLLQIEQNKDVRNHDVIFSYCLELEKLDHALLNHERLQVYTLLTKNFLRIALQDQSKIDAYRSVIKYGKQSIAIQEDIEVYLCMAKAYEAIGDYSNLTSVLQQTSRLDRLNPEMFSYYTKLATLDFVTYKSLLFEIIGAFSRYRYELPDYKQQFMAKVTTTWPVKPKSKLQDISTIHSFIARFPMERAKEGLFLERYHPHIVRILQKNPSKKMQTILMSIKRLKAIDKELWINGLIHELNKEANSAKITILKEYLEINDEQLVELLIEILKDRNTPTLRRYMTAKALIRLSQFRFIAQHVDSTDEELKLITTLLLRNMGFNIPQKTFSLRFQGSCFAANNHFLQYLLTQLYMQQECPDSFIELAMNQGQPINQIYVAYFCIKHKQNDSHFYRWGNTFLKSRTDKRHPLDLRCLAYYFFANRTNLSLPIWEDLRYTLLDKDEHVDIKLSVLQAISNVVRAKSWKDSFILKDQDFWVDCANANNHSLIHTLILRLLTNKNLKDYMEKREHNYWLRGYAYFVRLQRFNIGGQNGLVKAMSTLQKLREQPQYIQQVFIENEPHILLRGYGYMLLGFLGKEPLKYIEQETNPLARSYILLSCTAPVPPFATKERLPKKKRLALIKKYISSKNEIIKSSSCYTYGYISNVPVTGEEVSNSSFAAGIFSNVQRGENEQALLWQYNNPDFDKSMFRYYTLDNFYARARDNANKYIEVLQKLIEIDPAKADYYFYAGIVYKQQNKWGLAEKFFDMALQKQQDIFILLEKLSCLRYKQQRFPNPDINDQINLLLETISDNLNVQPVTGAALEPLMTMQNPKVEKILQQNLASKLLKQNASRKKLLITALQMLRSFYKDRGQNYADFDTYIRWLE